jgi:hypothetical protein
LNNVKLALMSRNQIVPFRFVFLSIVPGILLTLRGLGIYFSASRDIADWLLPLSIVLYALLLIFMRLRQIGKIETWVFPLLGSALWALWFLWNLIILDPRVTDYMLDSMLKLLTLAGLFVIYVNRKTLSHGIIYLFATWLLALILLELARTTLFLSFADSAQISISKWVIHFLPFLALCVILTRESNGAALLLGCSYMPFLIEKYLSQNISINVWALNLSEIVLARLAIQVVPHLCFLVIMPIVFLRIRVNNLQMYLLGMISGLVIFCISYSRVYVLQDSNTPFSLLPWAMLIYFMLNITSPLVFSLLLFRRILPTSGRAKP